MSCCKEEPRTYAKPKRMLAVMQFWDGDKEQAMETCRLIADMQVDKTADWDFLFSARFDTSHDADTMRYVARRFHTVSSYTTRREATGWPHGPNEMWFDLMCYLGERASAGTQYRGIFTMESDDCPLKVGWLESLAAEWDAAEVDVMGPFSEYPQPHINGNSIFTGRRDFLDWLRRKVCACSPTCGWDMALAPRFRARPRGVKATKQAVSWWNAKTVHPEDVRQLILDGVAYLHGIKDSSARDYVREHVLNPYLFDKTYSHQIITAEGA